MTLENGRLLIFNPDDSVINEDKYDLNERRERQIPEETLAGRISKRNEFDPPLSGSEAVEVAHQLGYFRTKG